LSDGHLRGAALDTFYQEPLPENHIFKNLNNVTITPHIAGASVKTAYYAAEVIAKDLKNYLDGKELINKIC
jgi:D-3-phosphoglycerate dehydrogenase